MKLTFNKLTIIVIVILTLLVAVFAVLSEFAPPKIKGDVKLKGEINSANFTNQQIIIPFNTPMDQQSVADSLTIAPAATVDLFWSQTNLNIFFKKPLEASTNYTISISKNARDIYGDKLAKDFKFEFKTKDDILAYLHRGNKSQNIPDKIQLTDVSFSSQKEIYSGYDVEFFDLNSNYLSVAINPKNNYSTLILKNLKSLEEKEIEIGESRITFLNYSPTENKFIYLTQHVSINGEIIIPDSVSQIMLYDIDKNSTTEIPIPDLAADVLQAFFSPDGKAVVIKASESGYFFKSLSDDMTLDLGKHLDVRGFNSNKDKILFVDAPFQSAAASFPSIVTVDGKGVTVNITDGTNYAIDPSFFYTSEKLIFAEKEQDLFGTKGLFGIKTFDIETSEKKTIYFSENHSAELPVLSLDDKYVVFEKYSNEDLSTYEDLRNFSFQSKPYNANLVLINLETGEIVDKGIRGVNVVWVR